MAHSHCLPTPILDKEKPYGKKTNICMDLSYHIGKNIGIQGKYEMILDTEDPTECFEISILPEF